MGRNVASGDGHSFDGQPALEAVERPRLIEGIASGASHLRAGLRLMRVGPERLSCGRNIERTTATMAEVAPAGAGRTALAAHFAELLSAVRAVRRIGNRLSLALRTLHPSPHSRVSRRIGVSYPCVKGPVNDAVGRGVQRPATYGAESLRESGRLDGFGSPIGGYAIDIEIARPYI